MRIAPIFRRLASFAVVAYAVWLPAQSFDLDRGREPLVSLDGPWRFHPGNSPLSPESQPKGQRAELWAQPGFDDSSWPLLEGGKPWSVQGYPGMSGFAWYRFTVTVPAGEKPTSLLLAPIVTSYQVYVDGKLVGGTGTMPPTPVPNTQISYHLFPLTQSGSSSARTLQVAIQVWHSPIWAGYVGGGPRQAGNLAGDPKLLAAEQQHHQVARNVRYVSGYSYSITAALVGFVILYLFLIRPAQREYLWFALILLPQAADNALTVGQSIFSWPPVPVYDLTDGILVALSIFAAFCFFSRILNVPFGALGRVCLALVAFSPFPAVSYWPGWFSAPASASIQIACLLPALAWILWVLVKCALEGNLDARLLLLPTLLDLGYYLADNVAIVLGQLGLTRSPRALEIPLPLPPFTVQTGILLHHVFLLALLLFLILRFTGAVRREAWLAGEIEAAREVQNVLLPDKQDQCPGFKVECIYQPANQVGGDFFQQIADGNGGMLIVVGDVSGKGLSAAMMVSVLVGAIRAEAAHGADPASMVVSLNERMMGRSNGGFTTCLSAHITADGLLTLANAGHLPPYLNGRELDVLGSLPLGIVSRTQTGVPDDAKRAPTSSAGWEFETSTVQLHPGDRLTFVSDGVVEAQSKSGELFGFDRTRDLSRKPAAAIAEAARAFGQSDDITVVTVEFSGAPVQATVA